MTRFAFVLHPLTAKDAARKYSWARFLPDPWIEKILLGKKPSILSQITGIESKTGAKTSGVFIACPLTSSQLADKSLDDHSLNRLLEAAEIARQEGAQVMGLGAFTAITGDAGKTLSERAPIAITTGNSYTVATAIEGTLKACSLLGISPSDSVLAVAGATGSIGKTCAKVLASEFREVVLVGRDLARTQAIADELPNASATTDLTALKTADAVVSVTSSDSAIIEPGMLKAGSVVCDVSRPRDVSVRVAKERPDVLVIEGGVVKVPGAVDFGLDFGFPPQTAYACMSETMLLALENRCENYTIGKDVRTDQVEEMLALAQKHGFELAGFRSFERAVTDEEIDRVRRARKPSPSGTAIPASV